MAQNKNNVHGTDNNKKPIKKALVALIIILTVILLVSGAALAYQAFVVLPRAEKHLENHGRIQWD